MLRRTFKGGVHPEEHKSLTADKPIRPLPPPSRVVVPLRQHLGAPARAAVQAGDWVAEGQPIGEPAGFVSVPVHAPIAGQVVVIESLPHPGGFDYESVVIEAREQGPDGAPWPPPPYRIPDPCPDYEKADPETLKKLIRAAGIVGMGGAAFPTHVKLSPPPEKNVDLLVINGAECEPFLTCDHRSMLEDTQAIVHGTKILMRILGVEKAIVGVEKNKPDAIMKLTRAFSEVPGVAVAGIKVKYPQGAEKQLIKTLTGREVPPPPGLPMDVGVVVQNVGTAAAVARAVMEGIPLIERVITVSGSAVQEPSNLRVRIGTPVQDLVEACGGLVEMPTKVVMGGPMMGIAQADLNVPVVKATSGFLFFTKKEVPDLPAFPCLRCGKCVDVCPMGLQPTEIARAVELGDLDGADRLHIRACMECGSCSFECPSNRWLVQMFRIGKAKLDERNRKAAAQSKGN
jgi:Na+-translocating ferredoxin:NAD+ oxidoreductase subunit C